MGRMARERENTQVVMDQLREAGVKDARHEATSGRDGNHVRVLFTNPLGRKCTVVLSGSTDHRAWLRLKSIVRRELERDVDGFASDAERHAYEARNYGKANQR